MAYFPLFVNLDSRDVLIVGGGKTALKKAIILLEFGANVSVVAPNITPALKKLDIKILNRCFDKKDINNMSFVIAATNNNDLNKNISVLCFNKNIPVNVVDNIELCSFIFPSILKQKDVVCAVSSGGKSPIITQYIRDTISKNIPAFIGDINDRMGLFRKIVKSEINDSYKRAEKLKTIFGLLLKSKNTALDESIYNIINGDSNDKN